MTKSKARPSTKEMRRLFDQIKAQGLTLTHARSGHWKVHGTDGRYLLTLSCSSGVNAVNHVRRDLRRYHGIELET